MKNTGFRSWDGDGVPSLSEDLQEDSTDYVTHTEEGVWTMAALHPALGDIPSDITLSIGYETAGHLAVTLAPDVARGLAAMLNRAADVLDNVQG